MAVIGHEVRPPNTRSFKVEWSDLIGSLVESASLQVPVEKMPSICPWLELSTSTSQARSQF